MKKLLVMTAVLFHVCTYAQNKLQVYDISRQQLRVMEKYKGLDSASRARIFIDSIYTPYKDFWNGYAGNADDVAGWLADALTSIPEWQKKNKLISGTVLSRQLRKVAKELQKMTGYAPAGRWYIVYGPAWTDLGGLGDFAMLIDLAHASNSSNEKIGQLFPHELTHQIMTHVNKHKDTTAISTIIGEGFAVWMNQQYWKNKLTLADNLGYTSTELELCDKNIATLKNFLATNKYSADKGMINVFRNRSEKLNDKLPGAIGYYLGYKIVESYVQKNGANSWKDIFIKSPREIYENSGF